MHHRGHKDIKVLGSTTAAGITVNAAALDLDDDELPVVTLSLDADTAQAGTQTSLREDDRSRSVRVTAARDLDDSTDAVSVTVTVGATGSTAVRGSDGDYTSPQTFTVRIGRNAASGSFDVTITPRQDVMAEGDEAIVFAGQVGDGFAFHVESTELTLADDDSPSTGIVLTLDRGTIPERAGSTAVRVTAALNGAPLEAETTVTLALSGTADAMLRGTSSSRRRRCR